MFSSIKNKNFKTNEDPLSYNYILKLCILKLITQTPQGMVGLKQFISQSLFKNSIFRL